MILLYIFSNCIFLRLSRDLFHHWGAAHFPCIPLMLECSDRKILIWFLCIPLLGILCNKFSVRLCSFCVFSKCVLKSLHFAFFVLYRVVIWFQWFLFAIAVIIIDICIGAFSSIISGILLYPIFALMCSCYWKHCVRFPIFFFFSFTVLACKRCSFLSTWVFFSSISISAVTL